LKLLRRRSETSLVQASNAETLAYFKEQPAQTGTGALLHAKALRAIGENGEADATLVLVWRSFQLGKSEQARFIAQHGKLLAPHHQARLEMALWRGLKRDVDRMLPLLPAHWTKLIEARRALRGGKRTASALIEALSSAVAQDAGLGYARFVWRGPQGQNGERH
jgi:soluble lytic murein transglycosylase